MIERRSILLLATGAAVLSACGQAKSNFQAVDITGVDYARDFSLTDQHGRRRTLGDFAGRAVVVFFGFTQCPDVCPTTLGEIAGAKRLLGPGGEFMERLVQPERAKLQTRGPW